MKKSVHLYIERETTLFHAQMAHNKRVILSSME